MLDEKMQAMVEQAQATMVEMWPPLWKQLYQKCMKEGFNENQSMELVKAYILSTNIHGSRP